MSWVLLDDGCPDHRKQLAAGAEACWMWACGLAYCRRQKAHDGFIPSAKVPLLYPVKNPQRLAEKLVNVGLWEEVTGGYQVHDYHDVNPDSEEVQERKGRIAAIRSIAGRKGGLAAAKQKQANGQAKPSLLQSNCHSKTEAIAVEQKGKQSKPDTDTDARSPLAPAGGIPPSPSGIHRIGQRPKHVRQLEGPYLQASFSAGIMRVVPAWAFPRDQAKHLDDAVDAHGDGLSGEALTGRIASLAEDFARYAAALPEDRRQFVPLTPRGFLRWLNDGSPEPNADASHDDYADLEVTHG